MSVSAARLRIPLALAVALVIVVCLLVSMAVWFLPNNAQRPGQARLDASGQPGDTLFTVASFNVLGHSHTVVGGNRPGWADGRTRTQWAMDLLDSQGIDLVGFQEFQEPQFRTFSAAQGTTWGVWPGMRFGRAAVHNSIAWRTDTWRRVDAGMVTMYYFDGNEYPMPWVRLAHQRTGREIYMLNNHFPANTRGPAEKWRNLNRQIEIDLVNSWRVAEPTTPVIVTGDKNEREDYFCPVVAQTELEAANGGSSDESSCEVPRPTKVDWILGTHDIRFDRYAALDGGLIDKITDHPLIVSQATIAPLVKPDIQRVLLITVDGLTARAVRESGVRRIPNLKTLIESGASTTNARTTDENSRPRPNLVSLLTGRPVALANGGHGVGVNAPAEDTVHDYAGEYASSVFDRVHNFGMGTYFIHSRPSYDLIATSYDEDDGGPDPYGFDDGSNKIDSYFPVANDAEVTALASRMLASTPRRLMVVSFSDLERVGIASGFDSREYRQALRTTDNQIGQLLAALRTRQGSAASTLIIVASTSGGTGTSHIGPDLLTNTQLPLILVGPGVPADSDLYDLNPQRADTTDPRIPYDAASQPIRTSDLANLISMALGLTPVPGSLANPAQDLRFRVIED